MAVDSKLFFALHFCLCHCALTASSSLSSSSCVPHLLVMLNYPDGLFHTVSFSLYDIYFPTQSFHINFHSIDFCAALITCLLHLHVTFLYPPTSISTSVPQSLSLSMCSPLSILQAREPGGPEELHLLAAGKCWRSHVCRAGYRHVQSPAETTVTPRQLLASAQLKKRTRIYRRI